MSTISKSISSNKKTLNKASISLPLLNRYLDYAAGQDSDRVLWFMKVIMAIPCVFMVLSIFAMASITPNYIWFVALSMLLFFANVIAHIAETKGSFFVPLYHFSVALLSIIPFLTYLIYS